MSNATAAESLCERNKKWDARLLCLRKHGHHALARGRSGDPDQRLIGIKPAVEVEDETVCGEKKWEAGAERVVRVLANVKGHSERAGRRPLEAQPEEQPPIR